MPNCFISHSWEDNDASRDIASFLKAKGCDIWIDYSKMPGGSNLAKEISEAIEWCDTLVLIWTRDAKEAYFVELEWSSALALGKNIIPCVFDETPLPAILASRLYIDFQNTNLGKVLLAKSLNLFDMPSEIEIRLLLNKNNINNYFVNSIGDIIWKSSRLIHEEGDNHSWSNTETEDLIEVVKWDSNAGAYKRPEKIDSTWHSHYSELYGCSESSGQIITNISFEPKSDIVSFEIYELETQKSQARQFDTILDKFIK